jgi:transposase
LQGIDRTINSYYDAPAFIQGAACMRGHDDQAAHLFSYVSPEQRVPADHPLRAIRQMTDRILATLSPKFTRMYSRIGRPSIAPEKLLRTLLLQALYTIRSERLLMEQLEYNLLFRWFVGLNIDDPVWDATVFSKNRDRLLRADVAALFFRAVLDEAKARDLVSDEHFTVDGTLLEAWASLKSFKKVGDEDPPPPDDLGNPTVNFHGETRSNRTHASTTDPDAKLARKGRGKEAKLSYTGNVLMENRNGLAVDVLVNPATGMAERAAAFALAAQLPGAGRVTIGGDKNYDTAGMVDDWRALNVTPHVAQNDTHRRSAIDQRTTRHPGYQISQRKRKRVEEIFGWLKTIGGLRKLRHRGRERVEWMFTFAVAVYNLVRLRNLGATG